MARASRLRPRSPSCRSSARSRFSRGARPSSWWQFAAPNVHPFSREDFQLMDWEGEVYYPRMTAAKIVRGVAEHSAKDLPVEARLPSRRRVASVGHLE